MKLITFKVPSHSKEGLLYTVERAGDGPSTRWSCNCMHYVNRLQGTGEVCKHIEDVILDPLGYVDSIKEKHMYLIVESARGSGAYSTERIEDMEWVQLHMNKIYPVVSEPGFTSLHLVRDNVDIRVDVI